MTQVLLGLGPPALEYLSKVRHYNDALSFFVSGSSFYYLLLLLLCALMDVTREEANSSIPGLPITKKIKMDESAFYQRIRDNFDSDLGFKLVHVVGSSDELSEWINVLSSLITASPTTKIPVLESDYQTSWTTSVSVSPVPLTVTFSNLYQAELLV